MLQVNKSLDKQINNGTCEIVLLTQGCFKRTACYTYQNSHECLLLNLCLVRCSQAVGLVCQQWYFSLSLFPHLSPFQHCPAQSVLSIVPLIVSLARRLAWASRVQRCKVLSVCVLRDVGGAQLSGVLLPILSSVTTWASEVPGKCTPVA